MRAFEYGTAETEDARVKPNQRFFSLSIRLPCQRTKAAWIIFAIFAFFLVRCTLWFLRCPCVHGHSHNWCFSRTTQSKCTSCDEAHVLSRRREKGRYVGTFCMDPVVCKCENGTPHQGIACADNQFRCKSCRAGYVFVPGAKLCKPKSCYCNNGTAAEGKACRSPAMLLCVKCDPNFSLEDERCVRVRCECDNGIGSPVSECPYNPKQHCYSCSAGFAPTANGTCKTIRCTCPNGKPVSSKHCPGDGERSCSSCNLGFVMISGPSENALSAVAGNSSKGAHTQRRSCAKQAPTV